jgi:hypothetical protein
MGLHVDDPWWRKQLPWLQRRYAAGGLSPVGPWGELRGRPVTEDFFRTMTARQKLALVLFQAACG